MSTTRRTQEHVLTRRANGWVRLMAVPLLTSTDEAHVRTIGGRSITWCAPAGACTSLDTIVHLLPVDAECLDHRCRATTSTSMDAALNGEVSTIGTNVVGGRVGPKNIVRQHVRRLPSRWRPSGTRSGG
ncbi:hypothetical protein [Kibdelosporangium philippinense]|uniref:hypothetical protein n=1 Tax=Kibdelosporangium philippinense TaxID=211113 RepID=UPI0036245FD0